MLSCTAPRLFLRGQLPPNWELPVPDRDGCTRSTTTDVPVDGVRARTPRGSAAVRCFEKRQAARSRINRDSASLVRDVIDCLCTNSGRRRGTLRAIFWRKSGRDSLACSPRSNTQPKRAVGARLGHFGFTETTCHIAPAATERHAARANCHLRNEFEAGSIRARVF